MEAQASKAEENGETKNGKVKGHSKGEAKNGDSGSAAMSEGISFTKLFISHSLNQSDPFRRPFLSI